MLRADRDSDLGNALARMSISEYLVDVWDTGDVF
jgi:hypothetical protein